MTAYPELRAIATQLTGALSDLDTAQDDLTDALGREATLIGQNSDLADQLKTARIGAALVPGLQARIAELMARVAELEGGPEPEPEPEPEPPTTKRTTFGACILDKGATGVVAKYGKGATVRQFFSTLTVPTDIPAGTVMHVSAKPAATVTDAQIDAWLKALKGHAVTIRHEPDNDGMSSAQIAEWKALNNRVYDRNVALGRPCVVAPTFTGGLFASYGNDTTRDLWMNGLKGDRLGFDFDGVHDNQTSKPADLTYRVGSKEITNADEIANAQRYIAKYAANGWQGITVPEFGISRATWDTTGEGRAKWIRDNAQRFIAADVYLCHWYDFRDTNTGISDIVDAGSPEHAELTALVAANPTTR